MIWHIDRAIHGDTVSPGFHTGTRTVYSYLRLRILTCKKGIKRALAEERLVAGGEKYMPHFLGTGPGCMDSQF